MSEGHVCERFTYAQHRRTVWRCCQDCGETEIGRWIRLSTLDTLAEARVDLGRLLGPARQAGIEEERACQRATAALDALERGHP